MGQSFLHPGSGGFGSRAEAHADHARSLADVRLRLSLYPEHEALVGKIERREGLYEDADVLLELTTLASNLERADNVDKTMPKPSRVEWESAVRRNQIMDAIIDDLPSLEGEKTEEITLPEGMFPPSREELMEEGVRQTLHAEWIAGLDHQAVGGEEPTDDLANIQAPWKSYNQIEEPTE